MFDKLWVEKGHADLVSFRDQVKDYCYTAQNRRCCYCSSELFKSKRTYDLEHIIDKSTRYDLMFTLKNLANACVMCNGSKGKRRVLTLRSKVGDAFPTVSDGYWLVHPYFDEWSDHFEFDQYGRVLPKNGSKKGFFTYRVCGIHKLNSMRLADYFSQPQGRPHENLLIQIYNPHNTKRKDQIALLKRLVEAVPNPAVATILAVVEQDAEVMNNLPPRYTSPDGSETWKGIGRKPKWVADYLAAGGELAELET